jgi:hypothetical protein
VIVGSQSGQDYEHQTTSKWTVRSQVLVEVDYSIEMGTR